MNIRIRSPRHTLVSAATLAAVFILTWSLPLQADDYGGRAIAATVSNSLIGKNVVADTGELSSTGGIRDATLSDTSSKFLSAETVVSFTRGGAGKSSSSTSVARVTALAGSSAELTASLVRAETLATATGASGSVEIHDLVFGGSLISVTGAPNQSLSLPGVASLVINEQQATTNGIAVNALHLTAADGTEVVVASAQSSFRTDSGALYLNGTRSNETANDFPISNEREYPRLFRVRPVTAQKDAKSAPPSIGGRLYGGEVPPPPPPPKKEECFDFVTGGGFFFGSTDGPGRVNFGFNAGYKNGTQVPLQVHFNLIDHNSGRHLKVQTGDYYRPGTFFGDPCHCREFSGPDRDTGVQVRVEVCDLGEPGRGVDKFAVRAGDYFAVGDPIVGGNIQLHKACPMAGCEDSR